MTLSDTWRADPFGTHYRDMLATLSEGSVHRNFDPYLDIDWDSPEMAIDPGDPVNLEVDTLARYVLNGLEQQHSEITPEFLAKNGFM